MLGGKAPASMKPHTIHGSNRIFHSTYPEIILIMTAMTANHPISIHKEFAFSCA